MGPSNRCLLLDALPKLQYFDGKKMTKLERHFAHAFEGANGIEIAEKLHFDTRPATAPVGMTGRLATLPPGVRLSSQRLRPTSSRIDNVLVREPSPAPNADMDWVSTLNPPEIDYEQPWLTVRLLKMYSESLRQRLDTRQVERQNLHFLIGLLEREKHDSQPEVLDEQCSLLQAENQALQAVVGNNHEQLKATLGKVEGELRELDLIPDIRPTSPSSKSFVDTQEISEELRLENRLLERRLERLMRYEEEARRSLHSAHASNDNLQLPSEGYMGDTTVKSSKDADAELAQMLARNEEQLLDLRREFVRTAAAVMPGSGRGKQVGAATPDPTGTVDILTLDTGDGHADVWHCIEQPSA